MTTRRKAHFGGIACNPDHLIRLGGIMIEGKPLTVSNHQTPIASLLVVKEMHAYFVDVGQGDSILLVSPNDNNAIAPALQNHTKSYKTSYKSLKSKN